MLIVTSSGNISNAMRYNQFNTIFDVWTEHVGNKERGTTEPPSE